MKEIDVTPTWRTIGEIYMGFAESGEKAVITKMKPEIRKAFAIATAAVAIYPELSESQKETFNSICRPDAPRQMSGPTEQPEASIIGRAEREFSTRWAQDNQRLFAERLAEFFTTYGKGYLFDSRVRDGFITLIAETPDERARGQSVSRTAEK